jgi:hypothetical protein
MTHSVAATSNAAPAADTTRARAARTTAGTSFAEAHAAAVKDTSSKDKPAASSDSSSSASAVPKGERTQKVTGHNYVEIISGPRNGMFINNTGSKRDGEAFLIVKRHGREFHVYGSGKDRAVYEVGRKREDTAAPGTTGTPGTTDTSATPGTTGTTPAAGTGSTTG